MHGNRQIMAIIFSANCAFMNKLHIYEYAQNEAKHLSIIESRLEIFFNFTWSKLL